MNATLLLLALTVAAEPPATAPRESPPEYGHGLKAKDALDGWISLFDGSTTYGWTGAEAKAGLLSGGKTTTHFSAVEFRATVVRAGTLKIGAASFKLNAGDGIGVATIDPPGPVELSEGLVVRSLNLRPQGLKTKFNGKDLTGWKVLRHPTLGVEKQAKWSVDEGAAHAVGGPGALELQEKLADFVLQIEVKARVKLANGGVFFRADPGSFMNGYEAQVYNGCYDGDPAKPARYSTGAIDDRQLARKLVSRDGEPFLMTVIAHGAHLSTWVNGYQMTDWIDTRGKDSNPRNGLRTEAGTIQLQAHDPATDVEFRNLRIVEMPAMKK
jgi:hypothetical protein